jgi:uncharacterized protein YcbX
LSSKSAGARFKDKFALPDLEGSDAMTPIGRIAALRRYPVKSMRGEAVDTAIVTERGLRWDRGYALYDRAERRAGSAKDTHRFPGLLEFGARYVSDPEGAAEPPAVEITFPDGRAMSSDDPDCDSRLTDWFGQPTAISAVTDDARPAGRKYTMQGTFFDYAPLHLLTDAALAALSARAPGAQVALERFRPNVLIAFDGAEAFPENAWTGRTLRLGDGVVVKATDPCPRCVMPTLAQRDLPKVATLLKTIAKANMVHTPVLESDQPCLGSYAFVVQPGALRCGDSVWLD